MLVQIPSQPDLRDFGVGECGVFSVRSPRVKITYDDS